jgi:hypothetical protein
MQITNFHNVKLCYGGAKSIVAQMPLIGYFVRNAKGTREVGFSFEGSYLTYLGRMWLIQRFCNKLRLSKRL